MPIAYKSPLLQNVQERCSKFDDTMISQVHCAMGNLAILKSIMEVNGEKYFNQLSKPWCQLSMRRKRHCRLTGATIQEFT
uniref:Uncharacterized protein n=1 Tax=Oryza barthii TaxID=65489 RepID=A0A0D3ETP3_9ORYZ